MSSKNIQAIYPLTFMQQGMLVHNLKEQKDQGFLQVQCTLIGSLNMEHFRKAWKQVFQWHPVLRSTIHWENLQKPLQVVHEKVEVPVDFEDWSALKPGTSKAQLLKYLQSDLHRKLNLSKAPVTRIRVIKLSDSSYQLIWSCHHIIIDGWSSAIILKDVFHHYDNLCNQRVSSSEVEQDYQSFIRWYQNLDQASMQGYWSKLLHNYKTPALIAAKARPGETYEDLVSTMPRDQTNSLKTALRNHRITINSLILSFWGVLLGSIAKADDIVFGTTVSGRSGDLPGIEQMTGQFTNVLPVRIKLDPSQSVAEWLIENQKEQAASVAFEFAALNQITSWCQWPGHIPLFDTLVVVENFPWKGFGSNHLKLTNFASGITTTYPLNILVNPGNEIKIILRYHPGAFSKSQIQCLANGLSNLLLAFAESKVSSIADLLELVSTNGETIPTIRKNGSMATDQIEIYPDASRYVPPGNTTEFQLTMIWEKVLGLQPIGIRDNFFDLGGTSMLAVRLFYEINIKTGRNLPPSMLLEHPTIESLSSVWAREKNVSKWSSLVPLRASGSKPPLFTIHGGGGHVFFYQPLAKYLDPQQPVFALQPVGLDGETRKHQSIEEMASHYLETIRSVQPKGPFSILGTCLSDPVCVEMNNQMRVQGEAPLAIFIVDSSPFYLFPRKKIKTPKSVRIQRFQERFAKSPCQSIIQFFVKRTNRLVRPLKFKWHDLKIEYGRDRQAKILLEMRQQLQKLYYQYNWRPFQGKITLIKTSQNMERPNNWDEGVWSKLASEKVDLLVIPGQHYTRFEEPEVIEMAKQLQQYLDQLYVKHGLSSEKKPLIKEIRG